MSLEATDDLEQRGVRQCLDRPDPQSVRKLGVCEQNAHWKAMICRHLYQKSKDARRCVEDEAFVPRFVERGPGS
jgi:hypothetical protein